MKKCAWNMALYIHYGSRQKRGAIGRGERLSCGPAEDTKKCQRLFCIESQLQENESLKQFKV